jgi:hypothetical protein
VSQGRTRQEAVANIREAAYHTVLADAEWFDSNDDCTFYPCAAAIGIDPKLILD